MREYICINAKKVVPLHAFFYKGRKDERTKGERAKGERRKAKGERTKGRMVKEYEDITTYRRIHPADGEGTEVAGQTADVLAAI